MPTFPVCVCPVGPIESTPVFVTFPAEYERPEEKVVVATQDGTPFAHERIWPPVPCEVVARLPVPLPYKRAPDWTAAQPVPPFGTVSAFVRERVFAVSVVPLNVRFAESVRRPFVVVNGTRVAVRYVLYKAELLVRAVVLA